MWCVSRAAVTVLPCLSFFTIIFRKEILLHHYWGYIPMQTCQLFCYFTIYHFEIVKTRKHRECQKKLGGVPFFFVLLSKSLLLAFRFLWQYCSLGLLVQWPARKPQTYHWYLLTNTKFTGAGNAWLTLFEQVDKEMHSEKHPLCITFKATVYPWYWSFKWLVTVEVINSPL